MGVGLVYCVVFGEVRRFIRVILGRREMDAICNDCVYFDSGTICHLGYAAKDGAETCKRFEQKR